MYKFKSDMIQLNNLQQKVIDEHFNLHIAKMSSIKGIRKNVYVKEATYLFEMWLSGNIAQDELQELFTVKSIYNRDMAFIVCKIVLNEINKENQSCLKN